MISENSILLTIAPRIVFDNNAPDVPGPDDETTALWIFKFLIKAPSDSKSKIGPEEFQFLKIWFLPLNTPWNNGICEIDCVEKSKSDCNLNARPG